MEDFLLLDVFSLTCWANWPLNNPENRMFQLTGPHPVSCQVFPSQGTLFAFCSQISLSQGTFPLSAPLSAGKSKG